MERSAQREGARSIDRRVFLKAAGAATGAAVVGGIPAIVAAQKAPSFPKGTKVSILEWVSFVPASDVEFKRLAAEFGKLAGVDVTVDQINMNDLNPRITSAIETKAGPDIIMMMSNWPHLYADGLADVDDVAEEIAKRDGAYYEHNRMVSVVGNRWKAVPLAPFPPRGPTARTGSRRPAPRSSPRPGTSGARLASLSRRRTSPWGRLSATAWAIRTTGPTR